MVNYSKGKIYKIIDNTNNNIYIGLTTQALSKSLAEHRGDFKGYIIGKKKYSSSFKIIHNIITK